MTFFVLFKFTNMLTRQKLICRLPSDGLALTIQDNYVNRDIIKLNQIIFLFILPKQLLIYFMGEM